MTLRAAEEDCGAVFGDVAGEELALRYGDAGAAAGEYAALREAAGVVALGERGILTVSGPLRQKFLHGILSGDVESRGAGQGCLAALMDPRGHLLALLRVLVRAQDVRIETTRGQLEKQLEHYRVGAPVSFAVGSDVVLALIGPRASQVLERAGLAEPPPEDESHVATGIDGQALDSIRASDLPGDGVVLHAASEAAPRLWVALVAAGARPVGRQALDARRVELGRPWYGADVTEENLLHETGLVSQYHSATKGCYVGQEVIARLEARGGNVSRALRGLRLEAECPAGAEIRAGGKAVGHVTTGAVSPSAGPIALAYVHRNHFAAGTAVAVGDTSGVVAELPLEAEA